MGRILELALKHPRYGYRRIRALLVDEGWRVNWKRVYRLWRREGLKVPQRVRRRKRTGSREAACSRLRTEHPNDVWAWDFIHDRTVDGRSLKWLSVVDEFTRECVVLEVERSLTSTDVVHHLMKCFSRHGSPKRIRSDNSPEFIARAVGDWLAHASVGPLYIEPGAPWQNGYAESFHSRLRDELLNTEEFTSLMEAKFPGGLQSASSAQCVGLSDARSVSSALHRARWARTDFHSNWNIKWGRPPLRS